MFYSVELYDWKTEKFKNSYTQLKKRLKRTANPEIASSLREAPTNPC
jgi:hypothetical protein